MPGIASTLGTKSLRIGIMNLGEKLRAISQERGITNISEIARRARVSKTSCYRWFEGQAHPEIREAFRLATLFDVPLDWLADEEADFPPPSTQLPQGEVAVLDLYRALGLTKEEALRRLATAPRETAAVHGTARALGPARDETEADIRREQERNRPKRVEPKPGSGGGKTGRNGPGAAGAAERK